MTRWRSLATWLAILALALGLVMQPAGAQDDDGDDDDWQAPASQSDDDGDDDWDDDDGWEAPASQGDDDDWVAPASQGDDDDDWVAPAVQGNDDDDDRLDDDGDLDDDRDDDDVPVATQEELDDDDDNDDDDDDRDRPVPNQAIVQLNPGTDPEAFAARYGVEVVRQIPTANIVQVELDELDDDDRELDEIRTDGDVVWIELNYTSQAPEGRPRYFFTSAEGTAGAATGRQLPEGLEFIPAAACVTGEGVIVAVLDTGVDMTHPDLQGSVLANGVNLVEGTFDVSDAGNGVDDDNDGVIDEMTGHGTHVAGTVLQVAPDAQILPVKVLNSDGVGDTFAVTAGIHYALEQGAMVINLSLGSTYDSLAIRDAVATALASDVVVVAAAGNNGWADPPDYPAAIDGVLSIAATSAQGDRAPYSNYHPSVDLAIPGDNIASTYPGNAYASASGTSMSTAVGSGAVALVLDRQPTIAAVQVPTVLTSTSGPLSLTDPAVEGLLGAGEIDIDAAISCSG